MKGVGCGSGFRSDEMIIKPEAVGTVGGGGGEEGEEEIGNGEDVEWRE